jgi:acyl carrier protein
MDCGLAVNGSYSPGLMTISSRTPEGVPHRCPICGAAAAIEPSYPGGDACCPACGHLLWWFRDRLSDVSVDLHSSLDSLGIDSLELVELVMELEEQFDITISDADAERIISIEDAIRYIRERRADDAA